MNTTKGFSLIELLASTVILGVLITVVLAPLTQLFQNTARSNGRLRASTQAQEVVEYVRGQWQSYPVVMIPDPANPSRQVDQNAAESTASRSRYDRTCFALPSIANMTSVITVRALDRSANDTGGLSYSTCPNPLSAPASPPNILMKRVTVTLTATDGSRSSLTLDIPRP